MDKRRAKEEMKTMRKIRFSTHCLDVPADVPGKKRQKDEMKN